jgi:hypothetical protein
MPAARSTSSLCALLLPALAACAGDRPGRFLPTDADLRRTFLAHEAQFRELARMSDEDARVWRIAPGFRSVQEGKAAPRDGTDRDLPPKRWDVYRRLFRSAGLQEGLMRERISGGEAIFFPVATRPIGTVDSEEKGIAYVPAEPSPVVSSLDRISLAREKPRPVFRRLKKNWYLYGRYNE